MEKILIVIQDPLIILKEKEAMNSYIRKHALGNEPLHDPEF